MATLLTLVFTAAPSMALAQAGLPGAWFDHFKRANRYFAEAQYDKALVEYQAAYLLASKPRLLFNMAQSYRLEGDKERAKALYHRFLFRDPNGAGSAVARKYLSELEAEPSPPEAAPPPVAAPPPALQGGIPNGTREATLLPAFQQKDALRLESDRSASRGRWGPALLGIGGASLVTAGTISLLLAQRQYSSVEGMGCAPHCDPALLDGISTRANLGYVLLGTGSLVAATGLIWWLAARR